MLGLLLIRRRDFDSTVNTGRALSGSPQHVPESACAPTRYLIGCWASYRPSLRVRPQRHRRGALWETLGQRQPHRRSSRLLDVYINPKSSFLFKKTSTFDSTHTQSSQFTGPCQFHKHSTHTCIDYATSCPPSPGGHLGLPSPQLRQPSLARRYPRETRQAWLSSRLRPPQSTSCPTARSALRWPMRSDVQVGVRNLLLRSWCHCEFSCSPISPYRVPAKSLALLWTRCVSVNGRWWRKFAVLTLFDRSSAKLSNGSSWLIALVRANAASITSLGLGPVGELATPRDGRWAVMPRGEGRVE